MREGLFMPKVKPTKKCVQVEHENEQDLEHRSCKLLRQSAVVNYAKITATTKNNQTKSNQKQQKETKATKSTRNMTSNKKCRKETQEWSKNEEKRGEKR